MRPATAADVPALAALYADAARTLGPWCYAPEQVAAWAGFGADTPAFAAYVLDAETWVAVDGDGRALGFCGIGATGEVHSLYVRHDQGRRGLGSRLLAHGLARAAERGIERLAAWATPFSLPVFERAGFALVQRVAADYRGVVFERLRVSATFGRDAPRRADVQPRNPLHGVTLEAIVTALVAHYGWSGLAERIALRCFASEPSIGSSLKVLRKTPWAREKVESLYLFMQREVRRAGTAGPPSRPPQSR